MATTFTSTIDGIETDGNIVVAARCRLTGSRGADTATIIFSVDIPTGKGPYKPLSDLSEEDVSGWVVTALGDDIEPIRQELVERLNNRKATQVVAEAPWVARLKRIST